MLLSIIPCLLELLAFASATEIFGLVRILGSMAWFFQSLTDTTPE